VNVAKVNNKSRKGVFTKAWTQSFPYNS